MSRSCHYCGWQVAKVRRAGEPATCVSCRDLPAAERAHDAELERLVERHFEGDDPLAPAQLPTLEQVAEQLSDELLEAARDKAQPPLDT